MSLGCAYSPLPGRLLCVLSSTQVVERLCMGKGLGLFTLRRFCPICRISLDLMAPGSSQDAYEVSEN